MATPADVAELIAATRTGSVLDRGRAAAAAFRALSQLDPTEKRELALLVAERAAPQLVPRLQAQTGLDLDREQVQGVLDMVRQLDDEDVEDLRRTVRDPEARAEALRRIGTAAAAEGADATGLVDDPGHGDTANGGASDDDLPPPAPDTRTGDAPPAPATHVAEDAVAEAERALAEAQQDLASLEEAEVDLEGADADVVEGVNPDVGDVDLGDVERWEPQEPSPGPPEPYEPIFEQVDEADHVDEADADGADADGAAEPDLHTKVAVARAPLVERLRSAHGNGRRLSLLTASIDTVRSMDRAHRRAVVEALPDGWTRRRGLQRLLEADAIPAAEIPTLIGLLERPMARTWIAATAVECGLLDVDRLEDLLDPRSAARLAGRYGGALGSTTGAS